MNDIIEVSSPGKLILFGEHAVVYGKRAAAVSLDARLKVRLQRCIVCAEKVEFTCLSAGIHEEWNISDIMQPLLDKIEEENGMTELQPTLLHHVQCLFHQEGSTRDPRFVFLYLYFLLLGSQNPWTSLRVEVTSDLPFAAGLGSSAAFSVSMAASFLMVAGKIDTPVYDDDTFVWKKEDLEIINSYAFICEKLFHGNPSGLDNSLASFGGMISFCGGVMKRSDRFPQLSLLVVNTGVSRSTMELVSRVKLKLKQDEEETLTIFDDIDAITRQAENIFSKISHSDRCICMEDYGLLQDLITRNQACLESLDVSHPSIQKVCEITAKFGLASKLTGAGGGGCAFAIVNMDEISQQSLEELKQEMTDSGFNSKLINTETRGVTAMLKPS